LNLNAPQWFQFQFDERLGIELLIVYEDWDAIPKKVREQIIFHWEDIRGRIPDRIKTLDHQLEEIQQTINQEQNWERICDYFTESHTIATIINELNIWYRTQQEV
ncbi:MAG: radical protein, partial [Bacilli bacterium]|nr:radical protein [Bacilli bacterium]